VTTAQAVPAPTVDPAVGTPAPNDGGVAPASASSGSQCFFPCPPAAGGPGGSPSPPAQTWCPCPRLGTVIPEPPPQPLSKNVPNRDCTGDAQCGDGFCDRGRCAPLWSGDPAYGKRCEASSADPCSGRYLCLQGRCRSCVSDAECPKDIGNETC